MPETMSPREKVARIVDPREWELQDFGAAKNGGQMIAGADAMLAASLSKADAILAALASSGDHAELENAGHIVWWKEGGVSYFPEGESFTLSASCRVEPLVTAASASALIAQVAALRANEKVAMKECAEWARKAGEAIGKLETSEAAGIVEGWQDRATEAERKLAEARSMLLRWRRHAPTEALEDLTDAFLSKEAERG